MVEYKEFRLIETLLIPPSVLVSFVLSSLRDTCLPPSLSSYHVVDL
jgi:hypothetical protein